MKRFKLWLFALTLIGIGLTGMLSFGKFVAFPLTIVLKMGSDETQTGVFFVVNSGDDPEEITVTLADWQLELDGSIRFLDAGSLTRSLAPTTEFSPVSFRLAPQQRQQVNFTVRIPPGGQPGDRWAIFLVEGSDVEPVSGTTGEVQTQVGVRVRYGVKVFQSDPVAIKNGRITSLQLLSARPLDLVVTFLNTGTAALRDVTGRVEIRDERGETVRTLAMEEFTVLPDAEREVEVKGAEGDSLATGHYVALVIMDFGGDFLVAAELPFQVE
ncbi:MAG: hypothetical protein A2Z21_03865 [Candidatus Fraserbacteria bacterium RBG_16_55_9]|uniref:Pili assembly chaperone N-terminal domain-containing protein n=1 Tax=Fraserbacteria sp. (strain RBG_16_55_9) TaxID=1817864 RepID=A0A1F5UYM9_FRAXR|nr:MAG: hypothetical protein A2Z21_03865 [Candidatus Fraserbacteria bacterium RBG_16_55_9]